MNNQIGNGGNGDSTEQVVHTRSFGVTLRSLFESVRFVATCFLVVITCVIGVGCLNKVLTLMFQWNETSASLPWGG